MVKLDCGVREGEPCIFFFFLTLTWRGAHRKYPSCMVSTGTSGTWHVELCIQVSIPCRPQLTPPVAVRSAGCSAFERCEQIIVNVLHCVNVLEMTNYCCDGRRYSLYSQETEELHSRAIWPCQSCDKHLSTNHKVLDSVYLLFHCSCIQYIALSIAALGNNAFTISTGKTIRYQKSSLCSSRTQRNVRTYCSGWLWFVIPYSRYHHHRTEQHELVSPFFVRVSGGLGMRTFYGIQYTHGKYHLLPVHCHCLLLRLSLLHLVFLVRSIHLQPHSAGKGLRNREEWRR